MAYSKQTWDTTSYVNPTRMNHIEDGIADAPNEAKNLLFKTVSNISITTDNDGLADLSSDIPAGYVPISTIVGTGYVTTYFNGASNRNMPYVRITNYDGTPRANYSATLTVLCIKYN